MRQRKYKDFLLPVRVRRHFKSGRVYGAKHSSGVYARVTTALLVRRAMDSSNSCATFAAQMTSAQTLNQNT